MHDLFLRFTSKDAAIAAFKTNGMMSETAEEIPFDGFLYNEDGSIKGSFLLDVIFGTGDIWENTGTDEAPQMVKLPGFHVNMRWRGELTDMPTFGPDMVTPEKPTCVFS